MEQGFQSYTEKELRKLSRADLLEMLVLQSKEVEKLNNEIECLKKQLADKNIMIHESGSIAEASLKLNGVFEAAENAALQYLENIKRNRDIEQMAYEDLLKKAEIRARKMLLETQKKCEDMLKEAKKEAARYLQLKEQKHIPSTRDMMNEVKVEHR